MHKGNIAGLCFVFMFGASVDAIAEDSTAYSGEVSFPGASTYLPLTGGIHPLVVAGLDDDEELSFIVDSGASLNVIDQSIADELGFEVIGSTEIGAPGGPQIPADIVIVPRLRVGDVEVIGAEFVTMNILGFSRGTMHGVLGATLFTDYLLTFDWQAGHIELSTGELNASHADVLAYDAEGLQVEIEIVVAGRSIDAHVDTGSMGSFMLPGEMMEELSVTEKPSLGQARMVGGSRDIKMAELDGTIEFANLEFVDPTVVFMTPSTGTGNIGSRIMQNYRVTFDMQQHLIKFEKQADNQDDE